MLAKDEQFLVTDGVELTQGLAWLSNGGHWVHGRSSPGEWRQSTGCHVEFIWFWVDGNVFVETLIDLEDFFFCNFLFSDLSVLISDYNGPPPSTTWPDQQLLHKARDTLPPWSAAWQHLPLTPSSLGPQHLLQHGADHLLYGLHLLTLSLYKTVLQLEYSVNQPHQLAPVHLLHPEHPLTSFYPPHLTLSPPVPQNFI